MTRASAQRGMGSPRAETGVPAGDADPYVERFATFVRLTDEKRVLAEHLHGVLGRFHARDLVDIGAGDGELALLLRSSLRRYLAVECRAAHVQALRELGLEVVEAQWPTTVPGPFDAALLSYVLSPVDDLPAMLAGALEVVRPGGAVIAVAHEIEGKPWQRLLRRAGLAHPDAEALPRRVHAAMDALGMRTSVNEVTSHVVAADLRQMTAALDFVLASAGAEPAPRSWAGAVAAEVRPCGNDLRFTFHHKVLIGHVERCA